VNMPRALSDLFEIGARYRTRCGDPSDARRDARRRRTGVVATIREDSGGRLRTPPRRPAARHTHV